MEADWDLQAVVRACISPSSAIPSSSSSASAAPFGDAGFKTQSAGEQAAQQFSIPDPLDGKISNGIGDLHELYRPYFTKSQPLIPPPTSSFSPVTMSKEQGKYKQPSKQSQGGSSHTQRAKRRKNQMKKVCHVAAEALASDVWAWRKYGQKPIKGSPFPRGYYRCSSSKGCLARKQVERNRSDPKMFIITYTAEHNHPAPTHRNSLAGSTRQKTLTPQPDASGDSDKASSPTPRNPSSSSPATSQEKDDDEVEQEDNFQAVSDEAVSEDFFAGLEEFTAVQSEGSPDGAADSVSHPWFSTAAETSAGED